MLNRLVEREGERIPHRRPVVQQLTGKHDPAATVTDRRHAVAVAPQALIQAQLQALDPVAVHVGEAEHVGGQLAVRVEALCLRQHGNARQLERLDRLGLGGGNATLDPDKVATRSQALANHLPVNV